jgi:hypothetical protein
MQVEAQPETPERPGRRPRGLLKHGDFVAPEVRLSAYQEPADPNPEGMHGVLARFSRSGRASDKPSAFGAVWAVYPDAIQLNNAASSAQMRGVGLMTVVAIMFCVGWLLVRMPSDIADEVRVGLFDVGSLLFYSFILCFMWFFARPWVIAAWKLDMFAAESQPTIFDRKHRKVYQLFTPLDGSADRGVNRFKPIQLQGAEYDWDRLTAEHRVELVTSGQTVSRIHRLVLVARDDPQPGEKHGRLLEEINVGNSMGLGENSVPMLWEHLRRFMEERGPGVPQGEALQAFARPKNLWQSLGVVGPFGPRFKDWWRNSRFVVIVALICLPITLPMNLLWGVCNWISHLTMRKTVWPQVVHERVGKAIWQAE